MPKAKYSKKKDGRYAAKVSTGKYKDDGKMEYKYLYAYSSAELSRKVSDYKYQLEQGSLIFGKDTLFSSYAEKWLEIYKATCAPNTRKMYRYAINKASEHIGDMKISDISKSNIQMIINANFEHYTTCFQIRLLIKQILDQAMEDNMVKTNVCQKIKMPVKPKTNKRALLPDEIKAISCAEYTDREKAFVYVLFYLGLAKAEALALTQSNFDFKEKTVTVTNNITFVNSRPNLGPTKNKYRVRTIPIPEAAYDFLKYYVKSIDTIYLFTIKDGSPMTDIGYKRLWEQIIKKTNYAALSDREKIQWAELEKMKLKRGKTAEDDMRINSMKNRLTKTKGLTAYIFRHNYATMLYYSDISIKEAANLMGHADTKMIMEVYAHLDEKRENTSAKLDKHIKMDVVI